MISRRIIRTKVLQILYAHVSSPEKTMTQSESELHFSIRKTYDLYHLLFALLVEISDFASDRIESRKMKNLPTEDDLNPNLRFGFRSSSVGRFFIFLDSILSLAKSLISTRMANSR